MGIRVRFLVSGFLLFAFLSGFAKAVPTAKDISRLDGPTIQTVKTFMQESFELRMSYEYSNGFLDSNDRQNMHDLATEAARKLQETINNQKKLKQQIEDYDGKDWDKLYGTTNLWKRLSRNIHTSRLSKCEIDFYLAISSNQPQKNTIARDILTRIDSLRQPRYAPYTQFLNARTLALLASTDSTYKPLAEKEFNQLGIRPDVDRSTIFKITIEKNKLLGETEPGQLDRLVDEFSQTRLTGDLEIVLPLVFLVRNLKGAQAFEKTVKLFPQTEDALGSLILSNLTWRARQKQSLEQISLFEATLATQTAVKDSPYKYRLALEYLADNDKFQTPLILYYAGEAIVATSPEKCFRWLIKASQLQQVQKCDMLEFDARELARLGARMAHKMLAYNLTDCDTAIAAFDNYLKIANKKLDPTSKYHYYVVLNRCGKTEQSMRLLQKIAGRKGKFRNRARLDLIIKKIQDGALENPQRKRQILEQLSNMVAERRLQKDVRTEAVAIYGKLLLETEDQPSAQKALKILAGQRILSNPDMVQIKAKALRLTGRLYEAADLLADYIAVDKGSICEEVTQLLTYAVHSLDRLQAEIRDAPFQNLIENLNKLAEFSRRCTDSQVSTLFTAEFDIFAAQKDPGKLSQIQTTLEDLIKKDAGNVDLRRCRARLFMEQGKFEESARLWTRICKMRKDETPLASQRSRKWWRAKFFELDCWSKIPQTQKADVLHTIEVLENSFTDIPPVWAQKLNVLKQRCR